MNKKDIGQFEKYIGSCCGNSFIILDCRNADVSKQFEADFASKNIPRYSVDSALFLKRSNGMDVYMEIFEKDGSESDSCGNGAILVAYILGLEKGKMEMKDNGAIIENGSDRLSMSMSIRFSHAKAIENEKNCFFVRTGEPHIIYFVDNIKKFDLEKIAKRVQKKYPQGVNVNAVQKINDSCYSIRTYERGVFAETKSCGTGSLAAYLAISCIDGEKCKTPIEFKSAGGSHWISKKNSMIKLETFKKFCKFKKIK